MKPVYIVKSDGSRQIFDETKLATSLARSGANEFVISRVIDRVLHEIKSGMTTTDIYRLAFHLLKEKHRDVAVKYSLRRALFDLGPDGFPFEKLIAKIFNSWGYGAVTGQILLGKCVDHEVDVVAWRGDDLAMCEAKFHNEYGLKSDVKVALYVKARFDDLSENVFDYGEKERRLTERYIFTNTKFSESAIKYGECNSLKMISWDHPRDTNLHRIIEDKSLHPITCLISINHDEKRELITNGIIICRDLFDESNNDKLSTLSQAVLQKARAEASAVIGIQESALAQTGRDPVSGASIGLPA